MADAIWDGLMHGGAKYSNARNIGVRRSKSILLASKTHGHTATTLSSKDGFH
jgi:hypothetical protein